MVGGWSERHHINRWVRWSLHDGFAHTNPVKVDLPSAPSILKSRDTETSEHLHHGRWAAAPHCRSMIGKEPRGEEGGDDDEEVADGEHACQLRLGDQLALAKCWTRSHDSGRVMATSKHRHSAPRSCDANTW